MSARTESQEPTVPIVTTGWQGRSRRRVARLPVLLAVPAMLLGVVRRRASGRDAGDRRRSAVPRSAAQRSLMPVAAPEGSLSSTWFCAGGTGNERRHRRPHRRRRQPHRRGGDRHGHRVRGHRRHRPERGRSSPTRPRSPRPSRCRPGHAPRCGWRDVLEAPFVSALVEAPGGDIVVDHQVSGDQGADTGPCASAASSSWHFASGSTNREAQEILVLFNPFPDDAVVDITFATTEGFRAPQAYDGFIVPGGRVRGARRRAPSSPATTTCRRRSSLARGRLVADRIQVYTGFRGQGLAVGLGQPQLSQLLFFPAGGDRRGTDRAVHRVQPERGCRPSSTSRSTSTIPRPTARSSRSRSPCSPRASSPSSCRAKPGCRPGSATRRSCGSTTSVPVAVEQESFGDDPSARQGVAITPGSPLLADTWVLAAGGVERDDRRDRHPVQPVAGRGDLPGEHGAARRLGPGGRRRWSDLEVPPGGRLTVQPRRPPQQRGPGLRGRGDPADRGRADAGR